MARSDPGKTGTRWLYRQLRQADGGGSCRKMSKKRNISTRSEGGEEIRSETSDDLLIILTLTGLEENVGSRRLAWSRSGKGEMGS